MVTKSNLLKPMRRDMMSKAKKCSLFSTSSCSSGSGLEMELRFGKFNQLQNNLQTVSLIQEHGWLQF